MPPPPPCDRLTHLQTQTPNCESKHPPPPQACKHSGLDKITLVIAQIILIVKLNANGSEKWCIMRVLSGGYKTQRVFFPP
jgi:hypothetical protein